MIDSDKPSSLYSLLQLAQRGVQANKQLMEASVSEGGDVSPITTSSILQVQAGTYNLNEVRAEIAGLPS